jgi:hypothetical protein
MPRRPALPKDPSQRAKALLDMATGSGPDPEKVEFSVSQKFAQQGGLKGGPARAVALDKETRSSIARKAAKSRWGRRDEKSKG